MFGAKSFLEAFLTLNPKKLSYEFIMYFIVLNCYAFYDLWFLLFEIFIWINIKFEWMIIYKEKEETLLMYKQKKKKKSVCYCFVHNMKKNLTFQVDLWLQKVMWLRNGMSDFRKLSVKISVRLKKKSWSGAAGTRRFSVRCEIYRGGGALSPPTHPVQLGLNNSMSLTTKRFYRNKLCTVSAPF